MISSNLLHHKFLWKLCKICVVALLLLLVWASPSVAAQKLGDTPGFNTHPHNLSNNSQADISSTETDQICIFCHTPHNSSADGPLWNRPGPVGSFPLYGGPGDNPTIAIDDPDVTPDSLYGVGLYPNGASRLCLSCHDGVTAIGTVISDGNISSLGSIPNEKPLTNAVVDLSTSHPISFVYNLTVKGLIESRQAGAVGTYIVPAVALGYLDSGSRMQCTTCHDPHLDTRVAGYDLPMWRDNQTGVENTDYEKTCNACHQDGSQSAGLDIKPAFGSGAGQGVHPIAP